MGFTYKGLKIKRQRHMVTAEEVEQGLQQMLQQNPRVKEITDRPTAQGDEVVLDYAGFCDGEQFAGGTAENQTLVLGSGMFIPGFEEQLIGKLPGQEVLVKVTFPQQYHSQALAGKEAEFRCKLKAILEKNPYELDDTFAREVGRCNSLSQMRQQLQQQMQSYTDRQSEMDLQDHLLNMAAETLELTVTEEMLTEAVEEQLHNLRSQMAMQGMTLESYCQFTNTTEEDLRKELRPQAEVAVRSRATVEEIVRLESLKAEQADIDKALEVICRHNQITPDQMKELYDENMAQLVERSVLTGKVMSLLLETAVIEEA